MKQGEKLKIVLESRGLDKTEAAKMLGISRRSLYQLFETSRLRDATLDNIKGKLGISLHDLENVIGQGEVKNTQQKNLIEDTRDAIAEKIQEKDRLISTLEQLNAAYEKTIAFLEQERNNSLSRISQLESENKELNADWVKGQKEIERLSLTIEKQGKKISEYEFRIRQYETARPGIPVAGEKK